MNKNENTSGNRKNREAAKFLSSFYYIFTTSLLHLFISCSNAFLLKINRVRKNTTNTTFLLLVNSFLKCLLLKICSIYKKWIKKEEGG